jgi:hypothetical protein
VGIGGLAVVVAKFLEVPHNLQEKTSQKTVHCKMFTCPVVHSFRTRFKERTHARTGQMMEAGAWHV